VDYFAIFARPYLPRKHAEFLVVVQFEFAPRLVPWQTRAMPKKAKPKAKRKPKRPPKEDFNQAAFRAVQETVRRSES